MIHFLSLCGFFSTNARWKLLFLWNLNPLCSCYENSKLQKLFSWIHFFFRPQKGQKQVHWNAYPKSWNTMHMCAFKQWYPININLQSQLTVKIQYVYTHVYTHHIQNTTLFLEFSLFSVLRTVLASLGSSGWQTLSKLIVQAVQKAHRFIWKYENSFCIRLQNSHCCFSISATGAVTGVCPVNYRLFWCWLAVFCNVTGSYFMEKQAFAWLGSLLMVSSCPLNRLFMTKKGHFQLETVQRQVRRSPECCHSKATAAQRCHRATIRFFRFITVHQLMSCTVNFWVM